MRGSCTIPTIARVIALATAAVALSPAVAGDAMVKLPALHISYQKHVEVSELLVKLGVGFCRSLARMRGNVLVPVSQNELDSLARSESERYFDGPRYAEHTVATALKLIDRQTCQVALMGSRRGEVVAGNTKITYRFTPKGRRVSRPIALPAPPVRGFFMHELPETLRARPDGQEIIAGEKADCFVQEAADPVWKSRACYWSQMHFYGGDPGRPVILKLQHFHDGGWKDMVWAIAFRKDVRLDAKVFEPPSSDVADSALETREKR